MALRSSNTRAFALQCPDSRFSFHASPPPLPSPPLPSPFHQVVLHPLPLARREGTCSTEHNTPVRHIVKRALQRCRTPL